MNFANHTTSITLGTLAPASDKTVTLYIRNEQNMNVTLELSTENWTPASAATYITISWDYNGAVLNPNDYITVNVKMSVASNISGITSLSFNILFTAVS